MKVKIAIAKSAGFCFGVERAIGIALEAAEKHSDCIDMLGDIVHNENVCKDIYRGGIKKIRRLIIGKDKSLLIRAHGIPLDILKKAKGLGYKIIDATCPMVKEIHKIAMGMEKKNYTVILIGDKDHAEVKGIVGHLRLKPLVIDSGKKLPLQRLKKIKKACVVVQSTQNVEKVERIFKQLKHIIEDLKIFNTICVPTRTKQSEIRILPIKNDIMIVIGSKTSANTRRLYEISKSLNKRTHWVFSSQDLKKIWFKGAKNIGVTAGASTPGYATEEIVKKIKELTRFSEKIH